MARYTCPSCGSRYNGKKCRNCYYEHFTEEIAHGAHVHTGEPLVIDAPVRRPVKPKDPFGCEKTTRKRHPLAGLLVLLALLNSLLPLIRDWGLELEARKARLTAPEPEAVHIPDSARILYQEDGITISALWQEDQTFTWDFPVYVQNDTRQDITVFARDIQINGYMMEHSHLWCEASAGTSGMGIFVFEEQDKVNTGILQVQHISFCLDISRSDDYEPIAQTPTVSFTVDLPEGTPLNAEPESVLLFEGNGIRVRYLGFAYPVSAYDPYAFEDGSLLFLFENETGRDVDLSLMNGCVNGTLADLTAWCSLPAGTKGIASAYVYPLEDLGITSPEEIQSLTFQLDAWDRNSYDPILHSEVLSIASP